MILVALTGCIGSGKSSVAERLAERGAVVIDSDRIVRELQEPGGAVLAGMVERWGERILDADGRLDRQAVADIVFNDKDELTELNNIVGPAVRRELHRRAKAAADDGRPVVMDIPLFVEGRWQERMQFSGVIVVDVPVDVAVERLVRYRSFSEADARARLSNQATREDRLALADRVVDNAGTPDDLDAQADALWEWVLSRPEVPVPPERPPAKRQATS